MFAAGEDVAQENHGGERGYDLDHEHHRVLDHGARIELGEGGADRRHHDLRVQHRGDRHALVGFMDGFHEGHSERAGSEYGAGVHREMLDDGAEGERREEGQAAHDEDDADDEADEQSAGGRERAR